VVVGRKLPRCHHPFRAHPRLNISGATGRSRHSVGRGAAAQGARARPRFRPPAEIFRGGWPGDPPGRRAAMAPVRVADAPACTGKPGRPAGAASKNCAALANPRPIFLEFGGATDSILIRWCLAVGSVGRPLFPRKRGTAGGGKLV